VLAGEYAIPFLGHIPFDAGLMAAFESGDYSGVAACAGFAAFAAVVGTVRAELAKK
jgi:hypothetical protein